LGQGREGDQQLCSAADRLTTRGNRSQLFVCERRHVASRVPRRLSRLQPRSKLFAQTRTSWSVVLASARLQAVVHSNHKNNCSRPFKAEKLAAHSYVGWNEPDEGNKKVELRKSTHVAGNGPHGDCQAQTVFDYRKDCCRRWVIFQRKGWNRRYTCHVQPSRRPQKLRKRADEELCDPV
jgi:hypothetical protein